MNCAQLENVFREAPLAGWSCTASGDYLSLQTPLRYPDGGVIEVFVETYGTDVVVTDFGEAARFLETHGIDPNRGATRRRLIELAISLGGATSSEGAVEIHVAKPSEIFEAALRLAQIITRIGDLVLSVRSGLGTTFSEEVEEFLRAALPSGEFRRNVTVWGKAAEHQIDLELIVPGQGLTLVEALSASTLGGATAQMTYTVAKFADIWHLGHQAPARVALLDDSVDVWTQPIRAQLQNFGAVYDWGERDELIRLFKPGPLQPAPPEIAPTQEGQDEQTSVW